MYAFSASPLFLLSLFVLSNALKYLRCNDFTGKTPSQLGELHHLTSLQLQADEFTGDMPNEIFSLRSGILDGLVADYDSTDSFSQVLCDLDTRCLECD